MFRISRPPLAPRPLAPVSVFPFIHRSVHRRDHLRFPAPQAGRADHQAIFCADQGPRERRQEGTGHRVFNRVRRLGDAQHGPVRPRSASVNLRQRRQEPGKCGFRSATPKISRQRNFPDGIRHLFGCFSSVFRGLALDPHPPGFTRHVVRQGIRFLIESECNGCGLSRLVSSQDGSLAQWEREHICSSPGTTKASRKRGAPKAHSGRSPSAGRSGRSSGIRSRQQRS